MTADELRERIAAALRVRFAGAAVRVWSWRVTEFPRPVYRAAFKVDDRASGDVPEHATEIDALASLAVTIGLNADGTDPRTELEALKRKLTRAYAAVLDFAPQCKANECWCAATREFYDDNANTVAVCDSEACAMELGAAEETEIFDTDHAEAIRDAKDAR